MLYDNSSRQHALHHMLVEVIMHVPSQQTTHPPQQTEVITKDCKMVITEDIGGRAHTIQELVHVNRMGTWLIWPSTKLVQTG